jgi:hypothetical protein
MTSIIEEIHGLQQDELEAVSKHESAMDKYGECRPEDKTGQQIWLDHLRELGVLVHELRDKIGELMKKLP